MNKQERKLENTQKKIVKIENKQFVNNGKINRLLALQTKIDKKRKVYDIKIDKLFMKDAELETDIDDLNNTYY